MRSTSRIAKVDESQFDVVGRGAVSADRSGPVKSYPVTDLAETRRIDAMIRRNMAAGVQAKLTVGAPNDKYEQEADSVAAQVMGMPDAKPAVQREGIPGEEEELQTKSLGGAIQREAMPEEEEEIQAKPLSATITPLVQREAMPEEEEEPIQAKLIQREAMPEEEEEIQAKRSSDGGFEAGGDFESRLSSSKSGGSPLPDDVRSFMEPRFGADFSGVRVHTGSEAVQMNRAVNAQAFAHGHNVYYGAGKGPGKDALTAHELTHTIQQMGSAVRRQKEENQPEAIAIGIQPMPNIDIQRAGVETYGGQFEPITYEDASTTDATGFIDNPSANIEIEFRANELVNCPKFGMTQTANTVVDGGPHFLRPEIGHRSLATGEHTDRAGRRENPMYGVDNQPAGTVNSALGGGGNASNSRWGHRIVLPDDTVDEAEAYLSDGPSMTRSVMDPITRQGQTVRQEFETTALCVEGELNGTYLGSVRWGYEVDAANNYTLFPFSVISMGAPTQTFMGAAQLWNDATVEMGAGATADTIDLPITSHQIVDPSSLNDDQLFRRIRELADEIQAMDRDERRKRTPDYQNRRFEARGLAREATRRGAVAADSGKTYTVKSGDTLWGIAAHKLGNGVKWTQIFALNVINILDPNLIFSGQELKMPEPYRG
jgi:hypothetical protein